MAKTQTAVAPMCVAPWSTLDCCSVLPSEPAGSCGTSLGGLPFDADQPAAPGRAQEGAQRRFEFVLRLRQHQHQRRMEPVCAVQLPAHQAVRRPIGMMIDPGAAEPSFHVLRPEPVFDDDDDDDGGFPSPDRRMHPALPPPSSGPRQAHTSHMGLVYANGVLVCVRPPLAGVANSHSWRNEADKRTPIDRAVRVPARGTQRTPPWPPRFAAPTRKRWVLMLQHSQPKMETPSSTETVS
ncbi:hypothetical protein ZHAS_00007963 [Anopheles sinensis]|uniref:Uncharacterized protein n=1 Tax=Anopheles sinensis TaxID=74873 RepID=A0A084VR82_ANOSI|nr:hypothetical protein ZHAS_00007963 [Anopheles sinensis]